MHVLRYKDSLLFVLTFLHIRKEGTRNLQLETNDLDVLLYNIQAKAYSLLKDLGATQVEEVLVQKMRNGRRFERGYLVCL